MMTIGGLHNVAFYLMQVGLLVAIGALLPVIFRIRLPKILLPYWQLLLVFCLVVPWFAPRQTLSIPDAALSAPPISAEGSVSAIAAVPPPAVAIPWDAILLRMLTAVIALGCAGRLGWLMIGRVRLARMHRRARPPLPFGAEVTAVMHRLGVKADIRISPRIESAATFGILRPVVLLPEKYETMDAAAQASILAHELIHVRRLDWLFAFGEQLILAAFWYHPAIWWLTRKIELAREQVVDRKVLELEIDRRQYLRSLLSAAADRTALASANLFFTRHHLKERVALLLEEIRMSRTRMIASIGLVSILLCLGAIVAAYAFPLTGSAVESAVTPLVSGLHATAGVPESPKPAIPSPRVPQKDVVPAPSPVPAPTPAPAPRRVGPAQNVVSGTVVDSSRGRIPGVQVTVADPTTNEALATVYTDVKGDFSVAVPVGQNVDLTFRQPGFMPAVVKNVAAGQAPLRIVLNLGTISETVTIIAASLPAEGTDAPMPRKVQPIRIGGNVTPPKLVRRVDPLYPVEARRQGIEGTVILQVYVGLSGEVLDTRVVKGEPPLDEAAIAAVRQWQYTPFLLNAEPQLGITTVTLIFKLDKQ